MLEAHFCKTGCSLSCLVPRSFWMPVPLWLSLPGSRAATPLGQGQDDSSSAFTTCSRMSGQ